MIVYAFIFARGGSKGLTNKNFRELNGKPLIAHAIEKAKAYDKINEVFVSTDNKTIKEIALDWDAQVIDRPTELAQDNTPEWLAWRHAVNYLENNKKKFDIFMSLPTTAPLRKIEDMRNCIDAFGEDTDIVVQ
jgi:CMP-N-acetylneuraminic acid synthetase